jgi:hypothetical protein
MLSTETLTILNEATGTHGRELQDRLIKQIMEAHWVPGELSEDKKKDLFMSAISALRGLKPKDEIEGMLGGQMLATHNAAMECLRRAMIPDQTFEGRDQNLKHAAKLLAIYTRQIETLDKHRGKGQQKMTVEYVNVEAGGQAVVGHVETDGRGAKKGRRSKRSQAAALSHNPDETIAIEQNAQETTRQPKAAKIKKP